MLGDLVTCVHFVGMVKRLHSLFPSVSQTTSCWPSSVTWAPPPCVGTTSVTLRRMAGGSSSTTARWPSQSYLPETWAISTCSAELLPDRLFLQ